MFEVWFLYETEHHSIVFKAVEAAAQASIGCNVTTVDRPHRCQIIPVGRVERARGPKDPALRHIER